MEEKAWMRAGVDRTAGWHGLSSQGTETGEGWSSAHSLLFHLLFRQRPPAHVAPTDGGSSLII